MRLAPVLGVCTTLLSLVPSLAAAQDTKKVGITMHFPAAVGVLWHASGRVAVRPELTFGGVSTQSRVPSITGAIPEITITNDASTIGTGVSVLFYVGTYDRLRPYISPRFTYSRAWNSVSASGTSGLPPQSSAQTTDVFGGAGSFGAQFAFGDRFSMFGEVGVEFAHSSRKDPAFSTTARTRDAWSTHAGVGIVFYP